MFTAKLVMKTPDTNADDVTALTFTAKSINHSVAHVLLVPSDEAEASWQVPAEWLPRPEASTKVSLKDTMNFEAVTEDSEDKFWFKFNDLDKNTKEDIIFTTEKRALTFTKEKI